MTKKTINELINEVLENLEVLGMTLAGMRMAQYNAWAIRQEEARQKIDALKAEYFARASEELLFCIYNSTKENETKMAEVARSMNDCFVVDCNEFRKQFVDVLRTDLVGDRFTITDLIALNSVMDKWYEKAQLGFAAINTNDGLINTVIRTREELENVITAWMYKEVPLKVWDHFIKSSSIVRPYKLDYKHSDVPMVITGLNLDFAKSLGYIKIVPIDGALEPTTTTLSTVFSNNIKKPDQVDTKKEAGSFLARNKSKKESKTNDS